MAAPSSPSWGTCATCGDAVPPGGKLCPTCGKASPVPPADGPGSRRGQRRLRLHKGIRTLVVIGVVLGLGGAILLALWQGPPVAADPLSASWNYSIAPGNYVEFSGAVTGGDYVTGNFTVVTPPGALVVLEVFNSTEYTQFVNGKPSVPASPPVNATKGLIDFAAIVTDNYYFVWVNPYTPGTHITLGLHAQTQYMSNVVVE